MGDNKLFSKHYSEDSTRHEDKKKFRNRILKYLEDFVNAGWPHDTYRHCRTEMGIDLKYEQKAGNAHFHRYLVEDTFNNSDTPITDILDFISVVYDSLLPHKNELDTEKRLITYVNEINRIFKEESMCYVLHENGRVRYYPDDEFHSLVKSTLTVLSNSKYQDNLKLFNLVLDEAYKNQGKESPIRDLFHCVEVITLSLLNNNKFKILNESSIDTLMNVITDRTKQDSSFTDNDREALSNMSNIFFKWVTMCHKYRHGKPEQSNHDVPTLQFNFIFSAGISIFRFLLEVDDKYQLIPCKT